MAESFLNRAAATNGKNNSFKKTPAISFQCQFQASSSGLRTSSGEVEPIMTGSSNATKMMVKNGNSNNGPQRYSREELVDIRNHQFHRVEQPGHQMMLSTSYGGSGESFDDSDSAIAALASAMALKIPLAIRRFNLSSSTSSNGDEMDVLALIHQQNQIENTSGSLSPTLMDGEMSPTVKKQYSRQELVLLRDNMAGNNQQPRLLQHSISADETQQRRFLSVIPPEIRRAL